MSKLPILLILLLLLLLGIGGGRGRSSNQVANNAQTSQEDQQPPANNISGPITSPTPTPPNSNPPAVPTPALLPGLVILLGGILRKQRIQLAPSIHEGTGEQSPGHSSR
ncbi:PTPA-CTERM sorting domain-containing protein [Kovacikia minuta CCNUW1]|uniref:PTPA-CTERM sorting domain-containing protein n=1 Tax=Kovacikia minuta TaxID=2931930 RepID=UPI001CC9316D|nr:PTPA-CTERM sorting domain-containing protein [Kovacikia minuta]UBF23562.1 PTPA-CTERM sorting domain-containing protein [Kovacikia minuta CCNUW1]